MTGSRADVLAALLDRIGAITESFDVTISDDYVDTFEGGSLIYAGGIDGRVEPHGGTSTPYRWRDEFTITLVVFVLATGDDTSQLRAQCGHLLDLVVAAVSTCWDPHDPRTRLVEPGAELTINGPDPGVWTPDGRPMSIGDVSVDLGRQLQPTDTEALQ